MDQKEGTLIKLIAGLVRAKYGRILVDVKI